MNMNRNQKILLVIGIIFLIILVATTPRYYEYPSEGVVVRRYSEGGKQLDLGEAFLRVAVVVLVTGGLILLLRDKKGG